MSLRYRSRGRRPIRLGRAAAGLVLLASAAFGQEPGAAPRVGSGDASAVRSLDAAREAAAWLESVRIETPSGLVWPVDPDAEPPLLDPYLYHGTPGVLLFLLELHAATGEARYLAEAERGGDGLLAAVAGAGDAAPTGFWTGVEGQVFTLFELYRATGAARFRAASLELLGRLRARMAAAEAAGDLGAVWDGTTDVVRGAAGAGFLLLWLHRHELAPGALEDARGVGDWLLSQAEAAPPDSDGGAGGLRWPMAAGYPRWMPNFSHGTAGVAAFLAELQRALGPDAAAGRYGAAAARGASHLLAIADRSEGGLRIHHHRPGGEELYYLGWCHGPPGTARLFHSLDRLDPTGGWGAPLAASVESLFASGIPARRPPGLWDNVGPCCGTAGVGAFLLSTPRGARATERRAFARALADDLLARSDRVDLGDGRFGRRWIQAEHRARPGQLQAQTGFMQGAAGVGLFLLQLDAAERGRPFGLGFPDDPFRRELTAPLQEPTPAPRGLPAESRQFDFWVGSWDVNLRIRQDDGSWRDSVRAEANIYSILNGKAVLELWDSAPIRGFSLRAFDAARGQWVLWLNWPGEDRSGTSSLTGGFRHGRGEFFSTRTGADGAETLSRYTFSDITPDSLRWDDAYSPDGGRTWRHQWIMEFSRTAARPTLPPAGGEAPTFAGELLGRREEFRRYERLAGRREGRIEGPAAGAEAAAASLTGYRVLRGAALLFFLRHEQPSGRREAFHQISFNTYADRFELLRLDDDPHSPARIGYAAAADGPLVFAFPPVDGAELRISLELDGPELRIVQEERAEGAESWQLRSRAAFPED